MKSKELCIFLERLRSARNFSQENFTDNVVSLRQYRRYLSGESEVPFQVMHQLTEKLGIKTDNLLREFSIAKVEETELVNKLFNLSVNYAHEEFQKISKNLPVDQIIDKNNQLLYQHSIIIDKLYSRQLSLLEAGNLNAQLINYPSILESRIITSIEMLILSSLIDFYDESHHFAIIQKIKSFIDDRSVVFSGGNEKMFIFILAKISKFYGMHEDFDNVIKFCQLGIEQNFQIRSYYLMEYFFYYQSLVYYRLEKYDEYEKMLAKCYSVLYFEGNDKKIQKFTKLIEEDYNIDFAQFVADYHSKNNKIFEASNE